MANDYFDLDNDQLLRRILDRLDNISSNSDLIQESNQDMLDDIKEIKEKFGAVASLVVTNTPLPDEETPEMTKHLDSLREEFRNKNLPDYIVNFLREIVESNEGYKE